MTPTDPIRISLSRRPIPRLQSFTMRYYYGEYDGTEFPAPDKLFNFDKLMQFILKYGEQALKAIEMMMQDPKYKDQTRLFEQFISDGMLNKDNQGKVQLTPKGVSRMQRRALMEVFANLRIGQRDGHEKVTPGLGGERIDGSKPYQFGDPVSELDLHQTLHNALSRHGLPQSVDGRPGPIHLDENDFDLHLHEGTTSCSTVILLDMSGSMMRYGRFLAAKKVALAMQSLVRSKFPQDSLDFVGFYSGAARIPEITLPLTMPKPISTFDYKFLSKIPLDQLPNAPQHFTNLHMGLQLARRILRKRTSENKQIFIITDGQPTAHVEGDFACLIYPPDSRSAVATIKEAVLAVRDGCRISTFALIEDYWGMHWVGFIDQLTKVTKGVAFYTSGSELSSCIMESYLSGRKKKTHIA